MVAFLQIISAGIGFFLLVTFHAVMSIPFFLVAGILQQLRSLGSEGVLLGLFVLVAWLGVALTVIGWIWRALF